MPDPLCASEGDASDGSNAWRDVFVEAVRDRSKLVLTVPRSAGLGYHRTRAITLATPAEVPGVTWPPDAVAFWAEPVTLPGDRWVAITRGGGVVSLSFRSDDVIRTLAAQVMHCGWCRDEGRVSPGLLIVARRDWSNLARRRLGYRVHVTDTPGLAVTIWAIDAGMSLRDLPPSERRLRVRITDLSVTGLGGWLAVPNTDAGGPSAIPSSGQRLRVAVRYFDVAFVLDATVRHVGPIVSDVDARRARLGVAFRVADEDADGRLADAPFRRMVSRMQREALRRVRSDLIRERRAA